MSQHDYVIANGTGAAVRSDLNNALAAIVTQNSGATAPATTYAYQWWADTTTGLLKIRNAANNAWVTIGSLSTAGFGLLAAGDTLTAALGSASTPGITFTGDLNTGIWSPAADTVAASTGGSERLRIDSSGRVGIGDTAPSDKVTIAGGASGSYGLTINNAQEGGGTKAFLQFDRDNQIAVLAGVTTNGLSFKTLTGGSTTEKARLDASGRLLVGTSTSVGANSARLQIKGAAGGVAPFAKYSLISAFDEDAGGIELGSSSSNSIVIQADPDNLRASSDISFRVDAVERMRITQAGYLKCSNSGVFRNTTGSYHEIRQSVGGDNALWIDHTASSGGLGGISINYTNQTPNNTGNSFIACADPGALRFDFRSNGGIANYSANNANLSDRSAKKDISPAAGTWDCIKEWEIVNYRYKDQPDDADLNLGVIAQQVAESCPEVITVFSEAKDDQPEKLGVKEQQMYWMAIKALQEAMSRIETLEAEVAALKAQ